MHVKGTAYIARKKLLAAEFGAERAERFFVEQTQRDPELPSHVLATTKIPAQRFLALCDALVAEFYAGDQQSYWEVGERSADFALGDSGPYRHLREGRSLERFAISGPLLWRNYFDGGEARTWLEGEIVHLVVEGLEPELHHVYFEYAVAGYFRRGLEMVTGHPVRAERLKGFSAGDPEAHYHMHLSSEG